MLGGTVAFCFYAQTQLQADSPVYRFKEPRLKRYRVEPKPEITLLSVEPVQWVQAWPVDQPDYRLELSSRVVLQVESGVKTAEFLSGRPLQIDRQITGAVFILQAPDAWTAMEQAEALARRDEVIAAYPVARRPRKLQAAYAAAPNDPYFADQWHLENRDPDTGASLGPDLNARAGWPLSRGAGIAIGFADDGIEVTHPDLAPHVREELSYNFASDQPGGNHEGRLQRHGTAVAGLAAAVGGNELGIAGVAPEANLAGWVIFSTNGTAATDEQFMEMFQYRSNAVQVQNHSWGNPDLTQLGPTLLERIAISNAVNHGRHGRGVVMVRSGGNNREAGGDVNDDGYHNDPRVIAVGSIRADGRVAGYSNPGACLLVAAPSGDLGFPNLFTTDRQGELGYNQVTRTNDLSDYAFEAFSPSGTSFSSPQIAGLAALLLSVNPELTYRDVQQILALSARHYDLEDPDIQINGAGLLVSHNVGYGVPDAGHAVRMARDWVNRPELTTVSQSNHIDTPIPDEGLRVMVQGEDLPFSLQSIPALPPEGGVYPDAPTPNEPLKYVGLVTNAVTEDLSGQAALIERGTSTFYEKLDRVTEAGAPFAIVFNNRDGDRLVRMALTNHIHIPAVFISENHGRLLLDHIRQQPDTRARIELQGAESNFNITNTLISEYVTLRVSVDHPLRGDLRMTLRSPQGTVSVMQHLNLDSSPGPEEWTYSSTQHFMESSAGTWTAVVSDAVAENTGTVESMTLTIRGVQIADSDRDGLDDDWERDHFESLAESPREDPDRDGYLNAWEQMLGTDPSTAEQKLEIDLSLWNERLARLSWSGNTHHQYQVWNSRDNLRPQTLLTNISGVFPQVEFFTPYRDIPYQFFQVREQEKSVTQDAPGTQQIP
jgi:subtilisin-like proprotein convertase family protein/subtilisin family serine protease